MTLARRTRRVGVALAVAALALVGGVATAPGALAHDTLVSSTPADGGTVAAVPDSVALTFDQPALGIGTVIKVTGPSGDIERGSPTLVDDVVTQALAPGAPAGAYRIAWRVTSADGHPVTGELTFAASAANPRAVDATSTAAPTDGFNTTAPASFPVTGLVVVVVLAALALVLALAAGGRLRRRTPR